DQPLLPGDTMTMQFALAYKPGMLESPGQQITHVLHNGSLIPADVLPQLGYLAAHELTGRSPRQKYGLKPIQTKVPKIHLPATLHIVVSTEADQIAVAPGHLVN